MAAKLLRPSGHRGRTALCTLAAGRKALKRAAATQTPYARSLTALLAAQADEAHARVAELHAWHVHDTEWQPEWREFVATVKSLLAGWVCEAPPRIVALMAEATSPRAVGYRVQAEEIRPLLTSFAGIRLTGAAAPAKNAELPKSAAPGTIAAAKQLLVTARSAVSRLRADMKNSSYRWRRRAEFEWARRDAITHARGVLWSAVPGRLARLAGATTTEVGVRRELAEAAAEVVTTLEGLGQRHGNLGRYAGEPAQRRRPPVRRARRTR